MKDLNRTIEKATMPNLSLVTSVNRKFLYSLCAVLCLLTCSLSTMAKSSYRSLRGYGYGFYYGAFYGYSGTGASQSDPYILPYTLGFSSPDTAYFQDSQCTMCSPFVNNYGDYNNSGNDKYIQLNVADDGYLQIQGGTSDFDSVFYLFDSNWNLITSGDDGAGSGFTVNGTNYLYMQPDIQYYATAGTYYLIIDGTNKVGMTTSGTVNAYFWLTH